jgi:hypothetical protein
MIAKQTIALMPKSSFYDYFLVNSLQENRSPNFANATVKGLLGLGH